MDITSHHQHHHRHRGVDDLAAGADARHEREIGLDPHTVESSRFRFAELFDPCGNTISFARNLTPGSG